MPDTDRSIPPGPTAKKLPSAYLPYGVALLCAALALEVRHLFAPYVGSQFPFATVYFAVTFVAWYGGWRPALLATLLGYLGASYFFIPPYHSFLIYGTGNYIGAGIYFFISFTSALFSEAQRKAQARAEVSAEDARQQEIAARASEARKTAILETALDAIVTMDHAGALTEFNPAAEKMFGYERAEVLGKEMAALLIPPDLREAHRQGLKHYLATGEGPVLNSRIEITALRADGTEFPVELAITRIPGEGLPAFSAHIRDITARKKTEDRQRFLAEASSLLASSLDYQTTLQSVAQLVTPNLADWFVIHLVNDAGTLELATVVHADPTKVEVALENTRRYPPLPDAPAGPVAVVRSGKSEWIAEISDAMIRAAARDAEHYEILSASGMKSYLCVPLTARGRTLGAMTLVWAESGQRYGPEDVTLAEELARRIAIAVDNTRLYQAAQEEIKARQGTEEALQESRDYYRKLTEAVPQLVWTTGPDGVPDYFNSRWFDYTGQKPVEGKIWWTGGVHPDDLVLTTKRWMLAVQTGGLYETEYRLKGANGGYRWFLVRGVPLKNEKGTIVKWFGTCTDIDEQKRAEMEIAALNARLRRSVQETHHRVKNNLQVISALAELQMEENQSMVPATALARIGQHTRSLAAVHDLLTQEAKTNAQADTLSTQAALDKLIPLLQATIGTRRIRYQADEIPIPIQEMGSLCLLVNELIANAIKHGRGDIELSLTAHEPDARLEVRDDGPGFPPDFDWRKAANTGLNLIDSTGRYDLRGTVAYENRPEGGAQVVVTFPIPQEA